MISFLIGVLLLLVTYGQYEVCDTSSGLYTVNWDYEFANSQTSQISSSLTSSFSYDTNGVIQITVDALADYVVDGYWGDYSDFGVTYVLDAFQFESTGRYLGLPNLCENRLKSDFNWAGLEFQYYWTYTDTPSDPTKMPGSGQSGMEYPESLYDLGMADNTQQCGQVKWSRTYSFNDLSSYCHFDWIDNQKSLDLVGYFYLTLVSPNPIVYDPVTDPQRYLTKQLQSMQIQITFPKAYSFVSSATILFFGSTISGADLSREGEIKFEVVIWTYVPNYLRIKSIDSLDISNSTGLTWFAREDTTYIDSQTGTWCVNRDGYRCWQSFYVYTILDSCSPDIGYIFNTDITLFANLACYDESDTTDKNSDCYQFLNNNNDQDDYGPYDMGTVHIDYIDMCDTDVYTVEFSGKLDFYDSINFTTIETNPQYESNGDIVYMQVSLDSPIQNYNVIGVQIDSAVLCTADVNSQATINSCYNNSVDINGTYDIMKDSALQFKLIHSDTSDNYERFSFKLPVLSDDRFFVDVTVKLLLSTGTSSSRRALLQTNNGMTGNDYQTFVTSGTTKSSGNNNNNGGGNGGNDGTSSNSNNDIIIIAGMAVGGLILIVLIIGGIYLCKIKIMKKNNEKELGETLMTDLEYNKMDKTVTYQE